MADPHSLSKSDMLVGMKTCRFVGGPLDGTTWSKTSPGRDSTFRGLDGSTFRTQTADALIRNGKPLALYVRHRTSDGIDYVYTEYGEQQR